MRTKAVAVIHARPPVALSRMMIVNQAWALTKWMDRQRDDDVQAQVVRSANRKGATDLMASLTIDLIRVEPEVAKHLSITVAN